MEFQCEIQQCLKPKIMQYACIHIGKNKKQFLIDASEILINDYVLQKPDFDVFKSVTDIEPSDDDLKFKGIYYGAFLSYKDQSEMNEFIKDMIGYALINLTVTCTDKTFNGWTVNNTHTVSKYLGLIDIETYQTDTTTGLNRIAFAALIEAEEELAVTKSMGETYFPKLIFKPDQTPDVFTSYLNRPGLFCFKSKEGRIKQELSLENWKSFVDKKRAISTSLKIK